MAGIYIHVPFCKTRCIYCDFFSQTDESLKNKYVDSLIKEIVLRKEYLSNEEVKTIYFGGGTPSQLNKQDFEDIFTALYQNFNISSDTEITLEANPDDLNDDYLNMLRLFPFNRLSVGIQSFDDEELKFLRRRHSANTALRAIDLSQRKGFDNINIDLIYGIPKQTMKIWKSNLDKAIDLNIQHISSYHLTYEKGTALYRYQNNGTIKPVNEDLSLDMFSYLIDTLTKKGFDHYEISNFAREGYISRHNSSYWSGEKYIGLGPSAHSYNGTSREWNISSLPDYIQSINEKKDLSEKEILTFSDRYNDYIITGLRTKWGISLDETEKIFGTKMLEYLKKNTTNYIHNNNIKIENNYLKLTQKGIFISDTIMSDLMYID